MPSTTDVLIGLLEPWIFLGYALTFLPVTIYRIVSRSEWATLSSWSRFQDAWFGTFWVWAGPQVRSSSEARVVPLLQGRVRAGRIEPPGPGQDGVRGTVVEIGPGSGMWVSIFTDKYLSGAGAVTNDTNDAGVAADGLRQRTGTGGGSGRITRVLGIEPNGDHHDALRRRVREAGLEGTYTLVPVGIEDIAKVGIERESVDCIATILCLCSIPEPEKNIRELYTYLKPGGRWFVYEHVKCNASQGWAMGLYQSILNLVWPTVMGGCNMCRNTERTLRNAGPWTNVDLAMPVDEPWYATTPHTLGVLTK